MKSVKASLGTREVVSTTLLRVRFLIGWPSDVQA